MSVSSGDARACPDRESATAPLPMPAEEARLRALLTASYRLSRTQTTEQAADVVADSACELIGADGAHLYLPDQLGGDVWSNANQVRTAAIRGSLTFNVKRELQDLAGCLSAGKDLFIANALAADAPRRALRLRHQMASLLYVPLQDIGVLVLWWNQRQADRPLIASDWDAHIAHASQALRRRMETTTLRDLSLTDPLTGLANRRALLQQLAGLPERAAVLLLDLDHFKRINDSLGHRYGDQVLETFARLLKDHAPEGGCAARYGGEEFAVVFPVDGRRTAEQTYVELRLAWLGEGLTFSGGLAEHRTGARAEETLEAADRALYKAKQAGRDRLLLAADVAWTDDHASLLAVPAPRRGIDNEGELTLAELDKALDDDLLFPHYQPVIDTRSGHLVAVEALARLHHPTRNVILHPAQFLPLAERTGRVRRIDRIIADVAIADVAQWRRERPDVALSVGVNVSVDHLDDPDLAAALLRRCHQHALDPAALIVEITETLQSVIGRGHEQAIEQLRNAGVNVTLDDFGTGFSALSYLLRFPVAGLKIDKSFTAALHTTRGQQLVTTILNLGQAMGLHVVAEGVETTDQLAWLTEHGCPFAQGFLISKPLPAQSIPGLLDNQGSLTAQLHV